MFRIRAVTEYDSLTDAIPLVSFTSPKLQGNDIRTMKGFIADADMTLSIYGLKLALLTACIPLLTVSHCPKQMVTRTKNVLSR